MTVSRRAPDGCSTGLRAVCCHASSSSAGDVLLARGIDYRRGSERERRAISTRAAKAKAAALASLVLWAGVISCGRLIACF